MTIKKIEKNSDEKEAKKKNSMIKFTNINNEEDLTAIIELMELFLINENSLDINVSININKKNCEKKNKNQEIRKNLNKLLKNV
jgi:hypothetical protein